ncbi:MAG: glycerol-3-phosphate 1-O-acyltransferase PlsY [candidate division KSB1 bacterium]|nr:glycerol-3-phosphate 1-O-acyltransferase PlsY [candidate division KSB1 bacterium]MDZ7273015.1 glycerol-3-phosphate 1-O-acyltransferase PlsY [candidate division KSB1 bacterium]MDZ7285118.1 glycerol-3-phosphate 1-O-acyltransferase PlsY [candidate division KSB1 bacterium]MDZ7298150.1 glycerol-3-phosphate 1-O-acyltransferase PlsY [candidate division KSB1 bacterium]MDZ7306904.1 glycerol-3-phosphate 1-O-acyltransferase PlsY [candidate division KSB1 bacterium]
MLSFLLVLFAAYLAGSFPTAILVGRLLRGSDFDIRNEGSGNAGGTNVFRVLGWQAGLAVMLVDVFKGFAATHWISRWQPLGTPHIDATVLPIVAGVAAVLGHIWTVFAGFRGGKGVGTAAGMILALYPLAALVCLVIFIVVVYATRYVSLGSMLAAVSLPVVLLLVQKFTRQEIPEAHFQFSLALAFLIVFTHRKNIQRLLAGTENRLGGRKPAAQTGGRAR